MKTNAQKQIKKTAIIIIIVLYMITINTFADSESLFDEKTLLENIETHALNHLKTELKRYEITPGKEIELAVEYSAFLLLVKKDHNNAVVYIQHHFGEGGIDYYLYVYSIESNNTYYLLTHKNTHGEYSSPGYIEITDLDNNGINEILIITGMKADDRADLFVFALLENRLQNIVDDHKTGLAYFNIDINQDGCDEIVSIWKEYISDSYHISLLMRNASGYYEKSGIAYNTDAVLKSIFAEIIMETQVNRMYLHDSLDFQFLIDLLKIKKITPDEPHAIQNKLEEIFNNKKYIIDKELLVEAMAWEGNHYAVDFLTGLIKSEKTSIEFKAKVQNILNYIISK